MDAIYIPRLATLPERTERVEFKEFLPPLETLTPVQGELKVQHCSNYLDVTAQADTIITLTCHRCLQQFNYRLTVAVAEIIWLQDKEPDVDVIPFDRDLDLDDLMETLPPDSYFEPSTWLYEQLCLEVPQRQLCDQQCAGIPLPTTESNPKVDHRWASLEALKNQLSSSNGSDS